MRNVLVLGSGRSGTSMATGLLAQAGYFMGDRLLPPSQSNPKGFFEDQEVNAINEEILDGIAPRRPPVIGKLLFRHRPLKYQRWLAPISVDARPGSSPAIDSRIRKIVERRPFCFKDPRYCYTLPIWRPHLDDTVFVCVFRHPAATVRSILRECRNDSRLHTLRMNERRALELWELMYRHVLEIHRNQGEWLFLHYDQLLERAGIDRLAAFVQAPVDPTFPDRRLKSEAASVMIPSAARAVYEQLSELAAVR